MGDGIGSSSSVAEVSAHQPPNRFLSMQLLASTCRVPRTDPWTSTTSRPRIEPSKYQAGLRGSISWLAPGRKRAIATLEPYSGTGAAVGGFGPFSSVFHLDRNAIQAEKRSRPTTPLVIAWASPETGEFRKMRITTPRPTHVQGRACKVANWPT